MCEKGGGCMANQTMLVNIGLNNRATILSRNCLEGGGMWSGGGSNKGVSEGKKDV